MRKLFSLVAALGLVMGAAQPAYATVQAITSATLSFAINPGGAIPPINYVWSGGGTGNLVQSGGGSITGLTGGIFSYVGSLPITDPTATPMNGLSVTGGSNGVGNFFGLHTVSGGGPMALMGVANLCLFAPCPFAPLNVTVPFTVGGVQGIGLGGAPILAPGYVSVTVIGNMWTTGSATIGTFTGTGAPLSDGGHVKLVSPTVIMTSNSAFPVIPGFGFLELNLVPEPGTLILLASGVAGLAMVGRKRMGK